MKKSDRSREGRTTPHVVRVGLLGEEYMFPTRKAAREAVRMARALGTHCGWVTCAMEIVAARAQEASGAAPMIVRAEEVRKEDV